MDGRRVLQFPPKTATHSFIIWVWGESTPPLHPFTMAQIKIHGRKALFLHTFSFGYQMIVYEEENRYKTKNSGWTTNKWRKAVLKRWLI